jgi:hypothetical protein
MSKFVQSIVSPFNDLKTRGCVLRHHLPNICKREAVLAWEFQGCKLFRAVWESVLL